MSDSRPVYLVDGLRTPFFKIQTQPKPLCASDLAVAVARPLLLRQPFLADVLDEVIFGCVLPTADENNIARLIALRIGCGAQIPAFTVQRGDASGLQAIDSACRDIAQGHAHLVLAGGTEAMSHAPLLYHSDMNQWLQYWQKAKSSVQKLSHLRHLRRGYFTPISSLSQSLRDPIAGLSMGQTAEQLAWQFNLSRQRMDSYAVHSHKRLAYAQSKGQLEELERIFTPQGDPLKTDNGLRKESNVETLSKLKAAFDPPYGQVTAGNSAQISDGAACLLLASEDAVEHYKLPVLARLYPAVWAGVEAKQMGLGPVHAIAQLLTLKQLVLGDIAYWELHEAFAAQVLACVQALGDEHYCRETFAREQAFGAIPLERLNIDGGGISLGHPLAASGARIVLHLAHVLQRQQSHLGIASLCVGGGQGGAMLLENPHYQAPQAPTSEENESAVESPTGASTASPTEQTKQAPQAPTSEENDENATAEDKA